MKIVLLGAESPIGGLLEISLATVGDLLSFTHKEFSVTCCDSLQRTLSALTPDVVINAFDTCSLAKQSIGFEMAFNKNFELLKELVLCAKQEGFLLVHYSTIEVFDGVKEEPYLEDDLPNPISIYGASKLKEELLIKSSGCRYLIFRLGWLYGINDDSLLKHVLSLKKGDKVLYVSDDQIFSPTYVLSIAETTAVCLRIYKNSTVNVQEAFLGFYNMSAQGFTSHFQFVSCIAKRFIKLGCMPCSVLSCIHITKEYQACLEMPILNNAAMDCNKLKDAFGVMLPTWDRCFRLFLEVYTQKFLV